MHRSIDSRRWRFESRGPVPEGGHREPESDAGAPAGWAEGRSPIFVGFSPFRLTRLGDGGYFSSVRRPPATKLLRIPPIHGPNKLGFPIAPRTGTEPALSAQPLDGVARWIAVVGGAGLVPVAPGTVGALVAVFAFVAATMVMRPLAVGAVLAFALVATLGLGTWASERAERIFGRHDDGRIVVDEVVGQWITLAPIVPFLRSLDSFSFGVAVVTAFVAFRLFDIWKPGAVRWAERRFDGGFGVMADDVVAGLYGALFGVLPAGFLLREFAAAEKLA